VFSVISVSFKQTVDLLYGWLDPRTRRQAT